jgi:hypothetical protein
MSESVAALQDKIETERGNARVVYEFPIPASLTNEYIQKSIGMVKLNGREEKAATKKSKGDNAALAFELVKASLREVDGRKLDRRTFEEEKVWNVMDPKLRNLAMAAYAHLHNPEDDETENFLSGVQEKVG